MPRYSIINEELVYKLIEEVKKRRWLVKNSAETDQSHADRYTIMKGWSDVAEEIGKPVTLVKQKWKSLRDMFWKEVRRCGAPDTYSGRWRFFKHLTFIYQPRKKSYTDEEDNDLDRGEPEFLDEEAETVSDFIKKEKGNDFEAFFAEDPLRNSLSKLQDDAPKKKQRKESSKTQEDFDVMFLTSLTPYFKQLEPLRKLVVRNKIQDLLISELSAQTSAGKKES